MSVFPVSRLSRTAARALGALALAATLVACGSDESPRSSERPLSFEEASTMADLLYRNYQGGGGAFVVSTLTRPGGDQLTVAGEVDWVDHSGWADITTTAEGASLVGVWWDESHVLERRPGLDSLLEGLGYTGATLISRAPDTERRVDQVIAIVTGLAAEIRDNAQLIMQTEGSAFLRSDTLRGRPATVVRYGTRNIYWIDAETGDMLRLEATTKDGSLPTVVDILQRGEVTVPQPETGVVDASAIDELYASLDQL